jgi:hypothetical protein
LFALLASTKEKHIPRCCHGSPVISPPFACGKLTEDDKGKGRARSRMQAGQGFVIDRRAGSSGKWIDSIDLIGSMEKKKAAAGERRPFERC